MHIFLNILSNSRRCRNQTPSGLTRTSSSYALMETPLISLYGYLQPWDVISRVAEMYSERVRGGAYKTGTGSW